MFIFNLEDKKKKKVRAQNNKEDNSKEGKSMKFDSDGFKKEKSHVIVFNVK